MMRGVQVCCAANGEGLLEYESGFPSSRCRTPGFMSLCARVVCVLFAAYMLYMRVVCVLRVSVLREFTLSAEAASRIALLLFHFASSLSRRLHQGYLYTMGFF